MKVLFKITPFTNIIILLLLTLTSCRHKEPLVTAAFVDSLYRAYTPDSLIASNERDIDFWQSRIRKQPTGSINEAKYAAGLIERFKLKGNISDLYVADSILKKVDSFFGHKLSGPLLGLVSLSIMRHRFAQADTFLYEARGSGIRAYENNNLGFDVSFELGRYAQSAYYLKNLAAVKDFNYFFRRSKYDHLTGNTDSAFSAMRQALLLTGKNHAQLHLAWSMLGDLDLHRGNSEASASALQQALRTNPADMHAMLNLGWLSLVRDQDTLVAGKLFRLAILRTHLPDPYYKLYQMGQWQHDTVKTVAFARKFAALACDPQYGSMYSKYLIELYAGILHQPGRAEQLAYAELSNRATPQTYTWYAYSLLCNNKAEKAYQVFRQQIQGKPIEGVELFYAGKVLKNIGHGLDADKCFDAALQNRYDLSPFMIEDIEKLRD